MAGAIGRLRTPDQDCRRPVVRMSSERMSTFPRACIDRQQETQKIQGLYLVMSLRSPRAVLSLTQPYRICTELHPSLGTQ
jgi:hypothetical protein